MVKYKNIQEFCDKNNISYTVLKNKGIAIDYNKMTKEQRTELSRFIQLQEIKKAIE